MQLFSCQSCGQVLFFENTACERCGHKLGYVPDINSLSALTPDENGDGWQALDPRATDAPYRFCANHAHDACNWLVPASQPEQQFCVACQFNRTIPNLSVPGNLERWCKIEIAKHRLFYTLLRLRLPMHTRRQDPQNGLMFDFLDDGPDGSTVMTGHQNGLITIALREADDAQRERMRMEMGEHYRTLLGHFRHEIGHYYWNLLVRDGHRLEECRAIFGDDRMDYQQALQRHYENGPPTGWRTQYVSEYATCHPWEDFAETWAHYLHIVSTLETAWAYGMTVREQPGNPKALRAMIADNPYDVETFDTISQGWLPLTYAVNSLNRSMGLADFYPFVLTPTILRKLAFIHQLVRAARGKQ
ncbi:zinc-binding metallopeptidase family protein [Novacetimonas cocois]|uniref:Zinc-ribbon domain-containing protein n=1 Tax=Novacetimonas cocois TaxID=1747507 RepID=A0A365YXT4_9PROT|nr:putative zinc-binding peptidase [Novacetimonas cocois]RBM08020.1 hypothetical protein NJLHNGOC_06110 [Novacetimonas cocois]